jgi:uncharacterized membrane protein (DUF4010 family)
VVGALNASLLQQIILPVAFGAIVAIGCALWLARRALKGGEDQPLDPGSPDMLNDAVKFVLVVAVVLVVAYYAQLYAGDIGVVLAGLLSGAIDVDAASVSASRLSGGEMRQATLAAAGLSVVAALVSNSAVKGVIARTQGTTAFAKPAMIVLGASAVAVGAGALVAWIIR